MKGLSGNYLEVRFPSRDAAVGDILPVRILAAREGRLEGRVADAGERD